MLNQNRLNRVMDQFYSIHADAMLVTDPVAIFYLTGKWIYPGERFLGMLLKQDAAPVLFLNELFRFEEEIGVRKIYITDTTDLASAIKPEVNPNCVLGVDKEMAAKFLLQLMDAKLASGFVNASIVIDQTREIGRASCRERV